MKAVGYLFMGIILGAVMGWFLGFLRLPDVAIKPSFFMGFFLCAVLFSVAFVLAKSWKKEIDERVTREKNSENEEWKSVGGRASRFRKIALTFVIAGMLFIIFLTWQQRAFFKKQMEQQDKKIREQAELIESARKSNMVSLMSNVLADVKEELKNSDTLSDDAVAKVAALSFSFKPYRRSEGDTLSAKELSPERGQLLIFLLLMKMDSISFDRIKQRTSFAAADLKGADLQNADLGGAILNGANLKGADLSGADLNHADLKDANLWGAKLNRANLSGADLKRADLRWAQLNGTDLRAAVMDGAQMSGAQLLKSDLEKASVQYAFLEGTLLNEANLAGVNFVGSGMKRTNLDRADLTRSDLRTADLSEANLSGAILDKVLVDSNWNDKVNGWRLTGVKEVQGEYSAITDSLDQWKHAVYRLKKNDRQ